MSRYMKPEEVEILRNDMALRARMKEELKQRAQIGLMRPGSFYDGIVEPPGNCFTRMGHHVATRDAIRIWCDCVGLINPLYRNPEYAKKSVWGGVIAPPNFTSCVSSYGGEGYANCEPQTLEYTIISVFNAGTSGEWFRPIREGDTFSVFEVQTDVDDITREGTSLQWVSRGKKVYKNQRNEIVSIMDMNIIMMAPIDKGANFSVSDKVAVERGPKIRRYSEQEIEEWYRLMVAEPVQGPEPRYWEDVNVGDEIPPYHQVACTSDYLGFGIVASCLEQAGGWPFWYDFWSYFWPDGRIDPASGLMDLSIGHLQDSSAILEGIPRAYYCGQSMTSWTISMVTNWMGDSGFLKKIGGHKYRRNLWRDSLVLCKGQVTKKYIEGGEHLVELNTTLQDHNGDFQIPSSTATVVLPTRDNKELSYWKL